MNYFAELGLSQPVVEAVNDLGFVTPTLIQSQAIPKLLADDTDLVGLAQTGTGKTAAFGLPLIHLVEPAESFTQALVLAPTRELCLQITNELSQFAKYRKQLRILPVYGGADIEKHIRAVRKGVHIIVATPGRLRDLMRRKVVDLRQIDYVVLDEADEMLNMGFKEEIDDILSSTSDEKLTWLFSATMPEEVRRIARDYMTEPLELRAGSPQEAHADIDHRFVVTRPKERPGVLKQFLDADPNIFALVFTRTRKDAQDLADELTREGYSADAIHGDLNQRQRDRVMDQFRSRRLKVLVATDVAARGIDVQDITHVFHFNIPDDLAFYTHRSGRTGRAGSKGQSIVLVHPNDRTVLRQLEKKQKLRFEPIEAPSGEEALRRQMIAHIRGLRKLEVNGELEPYMPELLAELEDLSRADLVKRVAASALGDRLDLLRRQHHSPEKGNKVKRDPSVKWVRQFVNIGKMDVADKGAFLSLICDHSGLPGSAIGRIDLQDKHSYFEVDEQYRRQLAEQFNDSYLDGRQIRVNAADLGKKKVGKGFKKEKKKQFGKK